MGHCLAPAFAVAEFQLDDCATKFLLTVAFSLHTLLRLLVGMYCCRQLS